MNQQRGRITQDHRTALPAQEVLERAKRFFADQNGIYAAFYEKGGPQHVVMRGQGGEEVVIAATPIEGGSQVTGSTLLFDQQVARFFASLEPYVEPPSSGDDAALIAAGPAAGEEAVS